MSRLLRAAAFAAEKHGGQKRKDLETPYINHPLAVADILATIGGVTDEDLLVAALLHDTVEDTDTSVEEVSRHFGERVAGIVQEVTDDKTRPKAERKRLQVVHAAHKSPEAKQLKIADKINNLQAILTNPPIDWDETRKKAYFEWANAVFQGLQGVNPELDAAFKAVYAEYG